MQLFNVQNSVGYTADSLMNLDCLLSTEKSVLDAGGTDYSFFNAAAVTIFIPLAVFILANLVRTAYVIRLTRSARGTELKPPHSRPTARHSEGDIELHERVNAEGSDETEPLDKAAKKKHKKPPGLFSRKFIAAWIVIFVTLQPTLTKAVFGLFACQQLEDGTQWVRRDMQVGCYSPIHKRWAFAAGVPGALLYPFGIPLGAAFLLYSHRNDLETRPIKKKFGFLYSG